VSGARLRLVVVSKHGREEIEERVREQLAALSHRLTVIVRRGDPTSAAVIRRAAARRAASVVLLPEGSDDDAQRGHRATIRCLLATRRVLRGRRVPIVLDVSHAGEEAIRLCVEPTDAMLVDAVEINARVLGQSIREPGAYDVVRQILSLDERTLFIHPAGRYA